MTEIYNFKEKVDYGKINEIAKEITKGKLVVFPTETVYGIGANALDKEAVSKIFKAKGRECDNPLIVHVSRYSMIYDIVKHVSSVEELIIRQFMPGPITLILPKKDNIPYNVTGGLETVGIRMPNNIVAVDLIEYAGVPIAAPSANISGKPSGTNIDDIKDELNGKVDYIIDTGNTSIGIESTVVKVENGVVNILRPGKITKEDFERRGYTVKLDSHVFKQPSFNEKVLSPGMKYRHYAPNVDTVLVDSDEDTKKVMTITNLVKENINKKIGIIGVSENKEKYISFENVNFIDMGSKDNIDEISRNLFSNLRKLDTLNLDICYIEGVKNEGLGVGIMNRLIRSCSYNVINV